LVVILYLGLAVTTVLILRNMSQRYRRHGDSDDDVPYGPSGPSQAAVDQAEDVVTA
jgi:cytochrome d ubiquinol oxidase subunit I